MKLIIRETCYVVLGLLLYGSAQASTSAHNTDENSSQAKESSQTHPQHDSNTTADHSKFKELKGPFANGPEVTQACLECHTEAGHQFMQNVHWTWEYTNPRTGQKLGKKNVINNFCTNARGNEGMCAQCHAGYGWKDESFDFTKQENIDCVVCHDQTGSYYKTPTTTGNAACSIMFEGLEEIKWSKVAQSVGLPNRENCGSCHFYGGGGDGVKHGDLDSSLIHPDKALDVHMDEKGLNFACTQCHITKKHIWAGSRYDVIAKDTEGTGKPGERRDVATCESCHSSEPHNKSELTGIKLNHHVQKIACQTCHIPTIARGGVATKTDWDWSTAGKLKDGVGYNEENYIQGNGEHRHTYKSIKGDFVYGENYVPEYYWFNGEMTYTLADTKFDPSTAPIDINRIGGSEGDKDSRIWPFKVMRTNQPYDKGNNTLVYMHLWGNDDTSFWGNFDFSKAIQKGMEKNGRPYSGEYGFIKTQSFWPITHMVAPKQDAVKCDSCHSKDSRLKNIKGVYLPARDSYSILDTIGVIAILLSIIAIVGHALIRKLINRGNNNG
jgi:octaheme c-type cytochrome (tetrathionate reductase family)